MAKLLTMGRAMLFASGAVAIGGAQLFDRREHVENVETGSEIATQGQEAVARAEALIQKFKEERGCPGISVGVSVNGKLVWREGFGYSNVENLTPCDSQAVMRIASISKPITTALLGKLLDEKRLDLDAPVQKYVPGFPEKTVDGEKVVLTTRQLVSHLGGIRNYSKKSNSDGNNKEKEETNNLCDKCKGKLTESEFDHEEYYNQKQYNSVIEALDMFKDDPLTSKPGTKYSYTTHGYTLISAVIEGASGQKFDKLLTETLEQFGMLETYLDENSPLITNRATFYKRDKKGSLLNVRSVNNSYKWAGGGLLSAVTDLLKFANVMVYSYQCGSGSDRDPVACPVEAYLSKATTQLLWTPVENAGNPSISSNRRYGMGWQIRDWPKNYGDFGETKQTSNCLAVSHGGGAVGATSQLFIKPAKTASEKTIAVAILINLQECGHGLHQLALKIAKIFDEFD